MKKVFVWALMTALLILVIGFGEFIFVIQILLVMCLFGFICKLGLELLSATKYQNMYEDLELDKMRQSEIHFEITTVQGGYLANIRNIGGKILSESEVIRDFDDVVEWLTDKCIYHFPESDYVLNLRGC